MALEPLKFTMGICVKDNIYYNVVIVYDGDGKFHYELINPETGRTRRFDSIFDAECDEIYLG